MRGPFGHVFIVVEENANYRDVIGDSSMPYLNDLARQYSLATQYYGNAHPSIGNYFMMTVGDTVTNGDDYGRVVSEDNVVRRLVAAGRPVGPGRAGRGGLRLRLEHRPPAA